MLLKDNKYNRPLYYNEYIGSTCIERIQVDSKSALSIIPKRLFYFLDIPLSRLLLEAKKEQKFRVNHAGPYVNVQDLDMYVELICSFELPF